MGNTEGSLPTEALESIEHETEMTRDDLQKVYARFLKKVSRALFFLTTQFPTGVITKREFMQLVPPLVGSSESWSLLISLTLAEGLSSTYLWDFPFILRLLTLPHARTVSLTCF